MKQVSLIFAGFLLVSCGPQLVDPSEANGDVDAEGQSL